MMHVGLAAWIIQDGNHGDFEVGREYRFALEFYPHKVAIASRASAAPLLSHVSGGLHEARGTIAFCSDRAWVVDFGVPAFQETKPPRQAKPGGYVSGRVYIGVDPFFYFERLKNEKGMPDLFRHWVIRRIFLETTPWQGSTDALGRKVIARDATRERFIEVPATDAWHHDGGHGHYVLECEPRPESAV